MLGVSATMVLTADQRKQLPTRDDVEFYRKHGYFVTGRLLSDAILDDALYGVERYYEGERDRDLPISGGFLDWRPEHGEGIRINDYVSLQNDELRALVMTPVIGAVAARLGGLDAVRLFHDQLIGKPPSPDGTKSVVGWHVDQAYWRTCTSEQLLTAWIPLTPYCPDAGPIMYLDESHLWSGSDWMRTFNDQDLGALEERLERDGHQLRKVIPVVERGCICFHHGAMVHGSGENVSDHIRLALTIHIQDAANLYRQELDDSGQPILHVNDLICRSDANGDPDYTDPDVCPIMWDQASGHPNP